MLSSTSDPNYSNQRLFRQVPENERRNSDIRLIKQDHPLLPLVLHALKDTDTERPTAIEISETLAALKHEPEYIRSVEQTRESTEQNVSLQAVQRQIQEKDGELDQARAHQMELTATLQNNRET